MGGGFEGEVVIVWVIYAGFWIDAVPSQVNADACLSWIGGSDVCECVWTVGA
jgi:hypothetical protein